MAENQGNSKGNVVPATTRGGGRGGNIINVPNPPVITDQAAQNVASQLSAQILNKTNVMLKQEIIKLPEFYGQPNKDTIKAMDLISRIDKCQVSNDLNDITTNANFRLCLWGEAEEWLTSKARHLRLTPEQKTWTRIRPIF
jgi:hypothetical protein